MVEGDESGWYGDGDAPPRLIPPGFCPGLIDWGGGSGRSRYRWYARWQLRLCARPLPRWGGQRRGHIPRVEGTREAKAAPVMPPALPSGVMSNTDLCCGGGGPTFINMGRRDAVPLRVYRPAATTTAGSAVRCAWRPGVPLPIYRNPLLVRKSNNKWGGGGGSWEIKPRPEVLLTSALGAL